jgi:hypothetical protein
MADFLDKLSEAIEARRDELALHLRVDAAPGETDLQRLVQDHWCPLPACRPQSQWAAYAIDGSVRELSLDNGSYLFVVQALCIGDEAYEEPSADVQILPPATQRSTASRFADLFQRHRELFLACETVAKVPPGSVLYLDGALYGMLPQLYKTPVEGSVALEEYPELILAEYLELLRSAQARGVRLVAVSKTSREATHCKLWLRALDLDEVVIGDDLTDSGMIHRWTDQVPGVSVPVILGTWGFRGGSQDILEREEVRASPAIVSFFVRLSDFDDALRVDVPASQLGCPVRLGELDGSVLDGGVEAVQPVLDILAADYGGLEVYNALLYSVDREVRLKRDIMTEVYLPLIRDIAGAEVRPDRSERRFA